MAVRLVGDRHGGMLNRARTRVLEPQPLQLGGDVDLSEERLMVSDVGVVGCQVHPRRTLPNGNHVRGPGCLGDPGCGAARPQVAAPHDKVDGLAGEALREAVGVLCTERGEQVGVVLVAGLKQRRLLVDDRDPGLAGSGRVGQAELLAVQEQPARVRLVHAGQNLDQGGLASTVLTDQSVRLTREQLDRPILQGPNRPEGFGCMLEDQERRTAKPAVWERELPPACARGFRSCWLATWR
jgi:hypothetical protein